MVSARQESVSCKLRNFFPLACPHILQIFRALHSLERIYLAQNILGCQSRNVKFAEWPKSKSKGNMTLRGR